ncbi:hypothetical protein T4C_8960 [Trichinella pseudospiralis]|uniref:Uncharacterized protein n=1 Tax=Trichinella pseudospiralis TaxID=6337 RepID=A0A0V1ILG1_TRIPS|nr:hypothetical protein T4C_8960 [Trichinella pseudospiralis]
MELRFVAYCGCQMSTLENTQKDRKCLLKTKAYCACNMKNNTDQKNISYYRNYAVLRRNGNAFCCLLRMPT